MLNFDDVGSEMFMWQVDDVVMYKLILLHDHF